MSFVKQITNKYPGLKKKLKIAHINLEPEEYVKEKLKTSIIFGGVLSIIAFMIIDSLKIAWIMLLFLVIFIFWFSFSLQMKTVDGLIAKRRKEIDKEVLFAGRFLMIKLNTGQPLINALVDASKSYGVGSKYFKEIVKDIELGTPMEDALENAINYTPSEKFQKILFQISNALKIGIDVSKFLESTLQEISNEQLIEIQRYAKKLNSITLFYMLMGIVIPSLGFTVFMVVSSIISIGIGGGLFGVFLGVLLLAQIFFMTIFKVVRPEVAI